MDMDEVTLRIAAAWRDLRRLRPTELSISLPLGQIDTMDVIARIGPCSMLELSEALRIDASTATRAVDPLVQAGYVARRRSERDARTVLVELTREGRRVERQLTIERLAIVDAALVDFDDGDRALFAKYLEMMVAAAVANREANRDAAGVADVG